MDRTDDVSQSRRKFLSAQSSSPKSQYWLGLFLVALAASLFGVAGALAKVLFTSALTPLQLTVMRAIGAALVMFLIVTVTNPRSLRVTARQLQFLTGFAVIWAAVAFTFYMAVARVNVAVALTLEYLAPVIVLLFGIIARTHRPSLEALWIGLLSVVGCVLVTGAHNPLILSDNWPGIVWGLLSGVAFALYSIGGNHAHSLRLSITTTTVYSLLLSMVMWLITLPWLGLSEIEFDRETIGYVLFIAIGATVVPFWLYIAGLKYIEAFPATIVGMLDPVVAGLAAFLLLGEILSGLQIVGVVVVFGVIATLKRREHVFLIRREA